MLLESFHNLAMSAPRRPREWRGPGGSSGRFGLAPRCKRNSTISVLPYLAAHPSGVEQMSSSRVQVGALVNEDGGAFARPLSCELVQRRR